MDDDFIERLEQKATYHAREAERYRTAAEVLRKELPGGRSRPRRPPTEAAGGRADAQQDLVPSTATMIQRALNEAYKPLHPTELVEEMRRLGWQTDVSNPLNTVRTAAHRLASQGAIERVDKGKYARHGLEIADETDLNDDAQVVTDGSDNASRNFHTVNEREAV